jgi:tryptophanyl-tRNA synthetase
MDTMSKYKTKASGQNAAQVSLDAASVETTSEKKLAEQEYREAIRDAIAGGLDPLFLEIVVHSEAEAIEAAHKAIKRGLDPAIILAALESRANL